MDDLNKCLVMFSNISLLSSFYRDRWDCTSGNLGMIQKAKTYFN